ncbi:MAG: CHRD domain-containing protein [Pseudolabrys sp.]|jgi:hypothetical protein
MKQSMTMKPSTAKALLAPALAGLAAIVAVSLSSPALAAVVNLKASLSPASEVPPTTSTGKGSVTATFDTDSKMLTYKGTYSDLTGPATAAHFHIGETGKNGGVAVPIFAGDKAGSPFEGKATLTDAQAADLLAGKMYVNVHTAANKGGEIRGQVTK